VLIRTILFIAVFLSLFTCAQSEHTTIPNSSIKAYFNNSAPAEITDPAIREAFIDDRFQDTIVHYIKSAKDRIDIAMFCAEDDTITRALNQAFKRGIDIRYIKSIDGQNNKTLDTLNKTIPVKGGREDASMHHKFMVIDQYITLLSSANNAHWDLVSQDNNMLLIKSKPIASTFLVEFETMWAGKFGTAKSDNSQKIFVVDGKKVALYFHPTDSLNSTIAQLLSKAEKEVVFAQMHFWGKTIADSILAVHEKGISVKGVLKSNMAAYNTSEYHYLTSKGIEILVDTVKRGIHHKFTVIDSESAQAIVLTGTYNWHFGSMTFDDCMLVIYDPVIAAQYRAEFSRQFSAATAL
jgi:phosphatidylserine/phosphatidylglycerophosphate/cardiolipin synthase-like enzyme